jgi:hypothetical protein
MKLSTRSWCSPFGLSPPACASFASPAFSTNYSGSIRLPPPNKVHVQRDPCQVITFRSLSSRSILQRTIPSLPKTPPRSTIAPSILMQIRRGVLTGRSQHRSTNLHSILRFPPRQFHSSSCVRYDRLQSLEDAANRDRDNAHAQAVFLQVFNLYHLI